MVHQFLISKRVVPNHVGYSILKIIVSVKIVKYFITKISSQETKNTYVVATSGPVSERDSQVSCWEERDYISKRFCSLFCLFKHLTMVEVQWTAGSKLIKQFLLVEMSPNFCYFLSVMLNLSKLSGKFTYHQV
jgi:hypothetical protein